MSVYRVTELPLKISIGNLIVTEQCLIRTKQVLKESKSPAGKSHEGLAFWLGRTVGSSTLVLSVGIPAVQSEPFRVRVAEEHVGALARTARSHGLGIVAQIHSHPGADTRHSEGDDQLVFMPFEGMFSLVVANFGEGSLLPRDGAGLHQYQENQWVKVTNSGAMIVVPDSLIGDYS